jgi:flavin reductase (DIM6/NTAB) family NADH-FMN oxidoreductase RutF
MTQIDEARFRQVMGHFASGVTVITTEQGGRLYGMTVSSFCSLSLQPPLVLICITTALATHTALAEAGMFAVNILSQSQEHLSRLFSSRIDDKFEQVGWHRGPRGLPLLDGSLASFECQITDRLSGGDHTIFVGEVLSADVREGQPLLYYRGGYHGLTT